MKSKSEVKPGNIIHIYHMFGNFEYRDSEGYVKCIDEDRLYGTWGEDELYFTDDWEVVA